MMYFANPTGNAINYMLEHVIGYIDTPLQGNKRPRDVIWCADNGCFNDKTFDERRWWAWLEKNSDDNEQCVFATAPDVLGDHAATLQRSAGWLPKIRSLGYKAAFVAQDGATERNTPWEEFDCLFVGGSTDFKLGTDAFKIIRAAKERGKWVHIGRVNSRRRFMFFAHMSHQGVKLCDSCDGTYLVFGPKINLPKLLSWIDELRNQPSLFNEV